VVVIPAERSSLDRECRNPVTVDIVVGSTAHNRAAGDYWMPAEERA
jgi:hypothetical protein